MKIEVYKLLLLAVLLILIQPLMAQKPSTAPVAPKPPVAQVKPEFDYSKELTAKLKDLDIKLKDFDFKFNKEFKVEEKLMLEKLKLLKDMPEFDFNYDFKFDNEFKFDKQFESGKGANSIEQVKTITKTYAVGKNDKLTISNQFGKVIVNTWKKNEIKVDVEINAFDNSEDGARELLNSINIEESKTGNLISFKTNIQRNTSVNWSGGKNEKKGITVNYTVYMPGRNALEVTNKFGGISLPDFDGPVNIKNSYGSVSAADLHHAENQIDVKNGSVKIENFAQGTINVSYGNLTIGNASQFKATVRFGSTKIGHLANGGNFENKYGSLKIDELDNDVKSLIINTDKGSAIIGVKPSLNFDFDITVKMGGFQFPDDNVNILTQTPDKKYGPQLTKNYKGKYGKGSDDVRMQIVSNYGSVKFQ